MSTSFYLNRLDAHILHLLVKTKPTRNLIQESSRSICVTVGWATIPAELDAWGTRWKFLQDSLVSLSRATITITARTCHCIRLTQSLRWNPTASRYEGASFWQVQAETEATLTFLTTVTQSIHQNNWSSFGAGLCQSLDLILRLEDVGSCLTSDPPELGRI